MMCRQNVWRMWAGVASLVLAAAVCARGGDSVGYRGINAGGHFAGEGLLKEWPEGGPAPLWSKYVGTGFAGPLVQDGKVYVIGGNPARLYVFTLDGRELRTIPMGPSDWKRFSGARSTPVKHGNLVLGQMPNSTVYAVNVDTGATEWTLNAWKEIGSGTGNMGWGAPESPMLHKNLYILNPSSRDPAMPGIAALDAGTGKVAWMLPGRKPSPENPGDRYSQGNTSGALIMHNGRAILVAQTWYYVFCLDAETGERLWEFPSGPGEGGMTPIYGDGYLLCSPPGRLHMLKLNADASDYDVLWTLPGGVPSYSHGVILDGRLYVFGGDEPELEAGKQSKEAAVALLKAKPRAVKSEASGLLCLDAATGRKVHFAPAAMDHPGHWWAADGMVYAWWLTKQGGDAPTPVVTLIRPEAGGFRVAGTFAVPLNAESRGVAEVDWQINTCPVICDGRLFLRYGSLYVYDLRIEQPSYGWRGDGAGLTENTVPPVRWSGTANVKWTCTLPGEACSGPAAQNGRAYVQTTAGLACVQEGQVSWTGDLPAKVSSAAGPTPAVCGDRVYAAAGGTVACFDAGGRRVWRVDVAPASGGPATSSPMLCEDLAVVQGRELTALNVADGTVAWRLASPKGTTPGTPARIRLDDGLVLFTSWGAAVRAADGRALAVGLPAIATGSPVAAGRTVYYCGSAKPGAPSVAAAYRLPARAGEAIAVEPLWRRQLDFACDGSPLVDADLLYAVDTTQVLHVLDADTGEPVYRRPLTPDDERRLGARAGGDLMKAGGALYAANLGPRARTVVFEPGREFRGVWEYAVKDAAPGNPAFELEMQYVAAGNRLYGIGGATPAEPVAPRVSAVAPVAALDGAGNLPVSAFVSDAAPTNWVVVGPLAPRSVEQDFLAAWGGASNAVVTAGRELALAGKTYAARALTDEWFTHDQFTAGKNAIDVSAVVHREWHTTACLFSVIEFDAERVVEFRLPTPGGVMWNPTSRLETRAWLAGRPLPDGAMLRVARGRYPLMLQVGVGDCDTWGKIWMAPRFTDVTEAAAEAERRYANALADWRAVQADAGKLFVVGEKE